MAQTATERVNKMRKANLDAGLIRYHLKELWIKPEQKFTLDLEIAKAIARALK